MSIGKQNTFGAPRDHLLQGVAAQGFDTVGVPAVIHTVMLDEAARNGYEAHHIRVRRYLKGKRFLAGRGFAEPSA